jgi:MFS family permease
MTAMNASTVHVALASISREILFARGTSVWVINAYMVTYGCCLLLAGRLGDLFGQRRVFLISVPCFTAASLGCGLAQSPAMLIVSRAVQGFSGAAIATLSLAQASNLFPETQQRARALVIYAFISACGGGSGFLVGGVLAQLLGWRSVFLVNVPLGIVIVMLAALALPRDAPGAGRPRSPLLPLTLFRGSNLATAGILGVLLPSAILGSTYVSAQYLQLVQQLTASQTGIILMCANLTSAVAVLLVSPVLAMRYGTKLPLLIGLLLAAVGLMHLARAPLETRIALDVYPGLLVLGLGSGIASNLLLLSALDRVATQTSGVIAGAFNTSILLGGALGVAILASIADAGTQTAIQSGANFLHALRAGYQLAYAFGAICAGAAALIGYLFLRDSFHNDESADNRPLSPGRRERSE